MRFCDSSDLEQAQQQPGLGWKQAKTWVGTNLVGTHAGGKVKESVFTIAP